MIRETILSPACALETYHNYTLLHDDLMDDAPLRRGQQTVHVRWDANTAILSGDSMLVLAFERMEQCDSRHLREVLRLFTTTALEIGEGQQYDMEFENRNDGKGGRIHRDDTPKDKCTIGLCDEDWCYPC